MAINRKMFEVAESKNMKGVHIINILKKKGFKRDSDCTEHLKAKTCRKKIQDNKDCNKREYFPSSWLSQQDSFASHFKIPRFSGFVKNPNEGHT